MKNNIHKKRNAFLHILMCLCIYLAITVIALTIAAPAFAQGDVFSEVTSIGGKEKVNLPSFNTLGHAQASYESGATGITSAILYATDLLKYMMGTITVVIIIAIGVRMITAGKKIDETAPKMKEALKYALIGLIVIIASQEMVKRVFFGEAGEIFRSETDIKLAAQRGTEQIKGIYSAIEIFVGVVAVLMIVIQGVRMVTSAGNEETVTKARKQIMWSVIGLVLIGISEYAVKDIIFPKEGVQLSDVEKGKTLIVNLTNFISGFVATIAIAMYMYGGYLYVTSVGKEDQAGKAKKVFMGATIGLLIAMGAFALVNTVITLQPPIETGGSASPANLPTNP